MSNIVSRRVALKQLGVVGSAALGAFAVVGCKSKPDCNQVGGLSADELKQRTNVAQYVEVSPDPKKVCGGCEQFIPAPKDACAGCKVVKGPVVTEGYCKLWVAKPT